jgi:hypothetical protein
VIDDYQGRGLGTVLLMRLAATAKRNGVRSFTAYVSPMNRRILEMVQAEATINPENGILRIEARLGVDTAGEANRELLRAAAAGHAEIRPQAARQDAAGTDSIGDGFVDGGEPVAARDQPVDDRR